MLKLVDFSDLVNQLAKQLTIIAVLHEEANAHQNSPFNEAIDSLQRGAERDMDYIYKLWHEAKNESSEILDPFILQR